MTSSEYPDDYDNYQGDAHVVPQPDMYWRRRKLLSAWVWVILVLVAVLIITWLASLGGGSTSSGYYY